MRANRELVELGAPVLVMTRAEAAEMFGELGLELSGDETDDVGTAIDGYMGGDRVVADGAAYVAARRSAENAAARETQRDERIEEDTRWRKRRR